jgi:hypothetical protein
MQYIFLLAKPLLWPRVRRHGVDLTYEYLCFPAVVAVVGHIENTVCTGSVGGLADRRKFPISAKMGVQVHDPAGLFLKKEPTAPLGKRLVEYQHKSVAVVQSLASQVLRCACLPAYVTCQSSTCVWTSRLLELVVRNLQIA